MPIKVLEAVATSCSSSSSVLRNQNRWKCLICAMHDHEGAGAGGNVLQQRRQQQQQCVDNPKLAVVPIMPTMPIKVLEAVATSCSSSSSSSILTSQNWW
jgi:hypothetical protein